MKNQLLGSILILLIIILTSHSIHATTLIINSTSLITDTSLDETNKNRNNGGLDNIKLEGKDSTDSKVGLLWFNISQVPSEATITTATLTLHKFAGAFSSSVLVHSLLSSWNEGTQQDAACTLAGGLGATWNNRTCTADSWNTPGLASGTDYNSRIEDNVTVTSTVNGDFSWNITTAVQEWHNGTATNNGLFLIAEGSSGSEHRFVSSEGTASQMPKLTITYTIEPDVSLISPSNGTLSASSSQTFTCNATTSSTTLTNATLKVWNSTGSEIISNLTTTSGSFSENSFIHSLNDGSYTWNCKYGISSGISRYAVSNNSLSIDSTKPLLTITTPSNASIITSNSIDVNFTISDTNLASCWWSNNSGVTNNSVTCGQNLTSQTWSEGINTVRIYANDTFNNQNTTAVTFTIDSLIPTISIIFPNNGSYTSDNTTDITFIPSDTNLASCWWTSNAGATNTSITCGTNITSTVWSEGVQTVRIYVNDSVGHENSSSVTFTIDITYPQVTIPLPANNTNTTNSGLVINFTSSDTNLASCWWSNNSGVTNNSVTCGQNLTSQTWSEGLNTIKFYANDSSGNTNNTAVTFRLDTTAPLIAIDSPAPSQEFSFNTSIPLNFTITDSGVGIISSRWFNIDGLTNTTITGNTTFNTTDGTHTLNMYANDSLGNTRHNSTSFTISLGPPAITLDSPGNNSYWNNGTNFNLNYTATDTNGIANCEVWHNINGTFSLNSTNTGISSGVQNFTKLNITDGSYLWNIKCEDTTAQSRFSTTNKTFTIDTIRPNFTSVNIQTFDNSQTINFTFVMNETNQDTCYYTIFNNLDTVDGLNNNVSVSCSGSITTATVSSFGTYNLQLKGIDLAGNSYATNTSFTTSSVGGGGGGGGSQNEATNITKEFIPVIGIANINSTKKYTTLDLEVAFARINDYCGAKQGQTVLAIDDFSGRCTLTSNDITEVSKNIQEQGINIESGDLILMFRNYDQKILFQGKEEEPTIKQYGLFTSILGITNPMRIEPPSLRKPFFKFSNSKNFTLSNTFIVNKPIKECTTLEGQPDLSCEVLSNTSFRINYFINQTNFFDKTFIGQISVTSDAEPESIEVKTVPIALNVYNFAKPIIGIPIWILIGGTILVILIGAIYLSTNKKIKKALNNSIITERKT